MLTVVVTIGLVITVAVLVWLSVRYFLLKQAIRYANRELREIMEHLEENRIVKLTSSDCDFEAFLGTVNSSLVGIRQKAVRYAQHEAELRGQIESISHDLRTPLTSIQGFLSLVDEESLDGDTRASLATVGRKADTLQRLIAQFYELSCLRDERFSLEQERVDVARLLRETVAEQYQLLNERSLDVHLAVPPQVRWIRANGDALERVFVNLLHNASKYAKTKLEVRVEQGGFTSGEFTKEPQTNIVFANDVEQLKEREISQLLEPFYRADGARSQESSGLGLAISLQLMQRMGGQLRVRQEERSGQAWVIFELVLNGDNPPTT